MCRERNREMFPEFAKVVDEFRAAFGKKVKVLYAEENGKTLGTPTPEDRRGVPVSQGVRDGVVRGSGRKAAR